MFGFHDLRKISHITKSVLDFCFDGIDKQFLGSLDMVLFRIIVERNIECPSLDMVLFGIVEENIECPLMKQLLN